MALLVHPGKSTGSAFLALLVLLSGALAAGPTIPSAFSSTPIYGSGNGGGSGGALEASWTGLSINRDQINEGSNEASAALRPDGSTETFPGTSDSTMQLYGGGVMLQKGPSRYGMMAISGGLSSDAGGKSSNWGLDIVGLVAEQRYPGNGWEVTAGFFAGYGQFAVEYRGDGYSRFESRFVASGATAGARWPTSGRLSFFLRSGYLWMPANGSWHGDLSGKMAKTYYDLSAPFAQAGMDLNF